MEFLVGFFMGCFIVGGIDAYIFFNDNALLGQFPKCIEKQFGKETIKKCYDIVEVKNE